MDLRIVKHREQLDWIMIYCVLGGKKFIELCHHISVSHDEKVFYTTCYIDIA